MKFNKTLLGSVISMALASAASVQAQEVTGNVNLFSEASSSVQTVKKSTGVYVVQLKGQSAISKAIDLGELLPSNQLVAQGNQYNARSANMQAYTAAQQARQNQVAQEIGAVDILHNYVHTFNGFSAKLTPAQANALKNHPEVAGVWEDQPQKPNTVNTPEFLGLNAAGGQHALDIKGEGVIVGILDTGITPENPSFADDGSYSDPAELGWTGTCDAGAEAGAGEAGEDTFVCNNKLIGARYFDASFSAALDIQYALGEFDSPRDADGHGSHTAGTAAGNEDVATSLFGTPVGSMTGMAPRARVAAYKVCWNSDYVNPETGDDEAGCYFGDSMAAIDQAVVDGVDVLNYSIGNSADFTTPVYRASLDALAAGVFFSASAGNSGAQGPGSVGNIAPWITTVGASTYDGISATQVVEITNRDPQETVNFVEGAITAPLVETGERAGALVIAEPLQGCFIAPDTPTPLDNAEEIEGNIALVQRGSCAFTEKVERAQLAGASAVIIYSDGRPVTALGGDGSYEIPGGMIATEDGEALNTAITGGEAVTVRLSAGSFADQVEVGNIMASFSSIGQNDSSTDIIKPDITAPGVRILAATSSTPMFAAQGEQARYLSGTSMSSPHIAGIAALLMGQNPEWTPSQVKSAMMTTARQDVMKPDGTTPADPFNFGAGHVVPPSAMEPGFTYEANYLDFMGFMCGVGNDSFVESQTETNCATLAADGFAIDPSQLNYPSIGIGELEGTETVSRTVTDMTGAGASYTATIEAPAGIEVSVATFDAEGVETEGDSLDVPADGKASFALTFTKTETAVDNEWVFGSITWTGDNGAVARSPIAILPRPATKIVVPESLSLTLNRGRASFPVQMLYSGTTSMEHAGLVAPFGAPGNVSQDPNGTFAFNEPELGLHFFTIPEGTQVARFALTDGLVANDGANLDLYLYRCTNWSCASVSQSTSADSNEDIILVNPEARDDLSVGNTYLLWVHGQNVAADASLPVEEQNTDYTVLGWIADSADASTRVSGSSRAIEGRFNNVRITTRGLNPAFLYMGGITFYNDEGVAEGTTVIEAVIPE